jgi:hypothetical protein
MTETKVVPPRKQEYTNPSPVPKRTRGNDYTSAASRPAPLKSAPAAMQPAHPPLASHLIANGGNVVMKEAYLPLPKTILLKNQILVPGPPKTANWTPMPLLPGTIPSAIPQNTEEFDTWAQSVHIASNYQMLQRVHEYMHYVNEITPGARSPLMNHVLTSWRLPSWLPEEQQLV